MMYVIVGSDIGARGDLRRKLLKKKSVQELQWEHMNAEELGIIASTPSLLGDTHYYLLTDAISDAEYSETIFDLVDVFRTSPHTFVFEESKLLKKPLTKLQKTAVEIHTLEEKKKEETFNIFALANAFGSRDRKHAWLLLARAFREGIQPENIIGVLHWKVRDMSAKSQKVYTKKELQELSRALIVMYHDAHRGLGDLSLQLERFVLSLGK